MQTAGHKLRKNRSGRWEVRYSEKLPDGGWRSRTASTGCTDRREAERWKDDFINNTVRLSGLAGTPMLGAILDSYEKARSSQRWNLVAPKRLLAGLPVDVLTPDAVESYVRTRTVNEKVTGSTVRRELGAVTAALNWAVGKKGLGVTRDMVPELDLPPPGAPRTLWLDEEQEPLFHAWAMGLSVGRATLHPLTLFIGLGLDTAARKEALLDLTWDRVDLGRGRVDFRVPGKLTGNKRRTVVEISARLAPLLERARREWLASGAPSGVTMVGVADVRSMWEREVGGSSWPWMTAHLMRHSWAKLHARAGVSLFDVATVLGDSYETVARNYLHDCPGNSGVVDRRWT